MIDFVLYAWLVMFALLFGFFFCVAAKIGTISSVHKEKLFRAL